MKMKYNIKSDPCRTILFFILLTPEFILQILDTSENWVMDGVRNLVYEIIIVSNINNKKEIFPKCKKTMN
jgi:hypothetical protein